MSGVRAFGRVSLPSGRPARSAPVRLILRYPGIAGLLAALVIWWLIALSGTVQADVLPSPVDVASAIVTYLYTPYGPTTLVGHALVTSYRVVGGFALGLVAGVALGVLMRFVPQFHPVLDPIFSFLRPVPAFAFVTLLMLILGIGEAEKIALLFLAVFPAMTVYTNAAFNALPPELEDAARSLGARRLRFFWNVQVPAALPDIFVGARIMLAVSWTAMMGAELVAAESGLGWMIWNALKNSQTVIVFAGVVCISAIAAAMDYAVAYLGERVTGGWRQRLRGGE